ncbi:MAG: HAMP domain-containing sensor histidine kinase [Spirochaetia bacterium]|nr:HAMP domain-containing sensor histidine kinase [Spirochaetia bacterium]
MKNSVVFRLSVKFSAILTAAVTIIILLFLMLLRQFSIKQEYNAFSRTTNNIIRSISTGNFRSLDRKLSELPFFVFYIIYDSETGEIIRQKNTMLGKLPETNGRVVRYSTKKTGTYEPANLLYLTTRCTFPDGRVFTLQIAQKTNDNSARSFLRGPFYMIALATIPILIISFFLSRFVIRQTLQPVVKITKAAATISASSLDQRLPETGKKDELDNLAITFNSLFERLKSDFDRERSFTSNVSHELKTPIAVILGQANLLRRWGKDDSRQLEKSLNTIIQETHSMNSIISNLLQLSRLESGKIIPSMEETDLQKMFRRLKEEFQEIKPDLTLKFQDEPAKIFTDTELLHQVFVAIISNSIKFIKEKPVIEISCTQTKEHTLIEISDNGPGFEEKVLPHVFERFYRGDSSHNRAAGGSGLGLSIAQAVVKSLNGKLTAENGKNGGAVLKITLKNS